MKTSKSGPLSIARFIALRYVSVGKRSQLVSFMSAVSILGLALGVAILVTVLSVMNGFDREVRENILGIVPHITITSQENISQQKWQELDEIIHRRTDVVATSPLIERTGIISNQNYTKGVLVNGIDSSQEKDISLIGNFMISGAIENLQNDRWGIVLGKTLADSLAVGLGDKVDLFSLAVNVNPLTPLPFYRSFTLVGIYRVGTLELDNQLAVINIDAARSLFRLRTPQTSLRIKLMDVLSAERVRFELQSELPMDLQLSTWAQLFGSIYENILFSRTIVSLMLWLLVAVAAFNLVVSLIMVVRDKNSDIAILRTMGASPQVINRIFMYQGCMVGLIGTMIGVVFGVLGALFVGDLAAFIESVLGVQILNAEVYPLDFLPSQIKLTDLIGISAGVMFLSLLATIYPAMRAASVQPAEALRLD